MSKLEEGYQLKTAILISIPLLCALFVWSTPLAFVPVPWPDDSAFYFVAKEFFKWPPRWVMLPQAPFEPTYAIFNFNTMPLYPILIGLGRWIGIDGSHALKFWPLAAWALSGSLLSAWLFRAGLPFLICLMVALVTGMDPALRWASVLVRPESLIGLFGMPIVLGLTLDFPKKLEQRGLWNPISFLLALGAYCHFNAVHLLFPVVLTLWTQPKRVWDIGIRTLLYLSPWVLLVGWHHDLFTQQLGLQWRRLAVPNGWLQSIPSMIDSIFDRMGTPDPWPGQVHLAGVGIWLLIFAAMGFVAAGIFTLWKLWGPAGRKNQKTSELSSFITLLLPSASWVLGAVWLWHTKPEVWFKYYLHLSIWTFFGVLALAIWRSAKNKLKWAWSGFGAFFVMIFLSVNVEQLSQLLRSPSWRWSTYYELVDCVDTQLTELERQLNYPKPFRVWFPTFPDITIEMSRRHPDWDYSRTNDFWERQDRAIQHAQDTYATVVTETINPTERIISGKLEDHPEIASTWMEWKDYFLNRLSIFPNWNPNRYICQRGRWQAFLFMKDPRKQ